jgi:hypothetical protein
MDEHEILVELLPGGGDGGIKLKYLEGDRIQCNFLHRNSNKETAIRIDHELEGLVLKLCQED